MLLMPSLDELKMMTTLQVTVAALTSGLMLGQDRDPITALEPWLAETIPGELGEVYPIFAFTPNTSFLCGGQTQGYYANPETDCLTFHVCANLGRK